MKLTHSVLSLTLAAGLVGSVAAYRATAGEIEPASAPSSAVSTTPAHQLVLPGATFAWAPCKPGARLERGTCVTDVVRTVVLPAAVPAASTVRADVREDDDHEEEYQEYDDDHEDDDHEDDDHEDDDHEDEDEDDEGDDD